MEKSELDHLNQLVMARGWKSIASANSARHALSMLLFQEWASDAEVEKCMTSLNSLVFKLTAQTSNEQKNSLLEEIWIALIVCYAFTHSQNKEIVRRVKLEGSKLNKASGDMELIQLLREIQSIKYPEQDTVGLTKAIAVYEKFEEHLKLKDSNNIDTTNRITTAFKRFIKNRTFHEGFYLSHYDR